jgi:hypothetical protein
VIRKDNDPEVTGDWVSLMVERLRGMLIQEWAKPADTIDDKFIAGVFAVLYRLRPNEPHLDMRLVHDPRMNNYDGAHTNVCIDRTKLSVTHSANKLFLDCGCECHMKRGAVDE